MTAMNSERIRIWDLPTRVFHWGTVLGCSAAWLTGEQPRWTDVHVLAGYVVAGLLLFRLLWGWCGGPYARFAGFRYRWSAVRDYLAALLRGNAPRFSGHNPAGSWAVYVLLGLLLAVSVTGLMVLGGEEGHGPLGGLISRDVGVAVHQVHEVLAWSLLAFVSLHLLGVVVESRVHRESLVAAMLSGYKRRGTETAGSPGYVGLGIALLLVVVVAGVYVLWGRLTGDDNYRPFTGPQLVMDATWESECGACHLAYHPSLLPTRSWMRMLDEQSRHFGEDLYLGAETVWALERYAGAYGAESRVTEAAWRMINTVPPAKTPLRITETPYWRRAHHEIPEATWGSSKVRGRGNCGACHRDAPEGTFENAAMSIPAL